MRFVYFAVQKREAGLQYIPLFPASVTLLPNATDVAKSLILTDIYIQYMLQFLPEKGQ